MPLPTLASQADDPVAAKTQKDINSFSTLFSFLFLSLPFDLTKQSGVKAGKGGRKRWLSWRKVGTGRRERVATDARSGDEGFGGGVWRELEWRNGWEETGISRVTEMKGCALVSPVLPLTLSIILREQRWSAWHICVINLFAGLSQPVCTHVCPLY